MSVASVQALCSPAEWQTRVDLAACYRLVPSAAARWDVPTVVECGFPGFEAGAWFGFFAPKGTPAEVVATLNKAVNEIVDAPATQAALIKEGADPASGTPQQFAAFVQREFEKWRTVVKESGATAD